MEDVTQGPSAMQEPPQCVGVSCSDDRERELEQLELNEEGWDWRLKGWRGVAYKEWTAQPPWARVRSKTRLPMRAMLSQ